MRHIRFGRTNATVSTVSLGTWGHGGPKIAGERPVGWTGHDDRLAREALVEAHARGINHWDTADVYGDGHAEELIGEAWSTVPRREIFLATKVGWDPGPYPRPYHPDQMRKQLDRSLRLLKTDVIDLYYLHNCNFGENGEWFDDAITTIRLFREEGKIRFIGLSDWDSHKIMKYIDRADPDVVQPYRNVIDDAWVSSGLRESIDSHDRGVAFFSPLRHGLLLGKYERPQQFPPGDYRSNVWQFGNAMFLTLMRDLRAEVELRFSTQPEALLHALIGALLEDAPTGCVLLGQRNRRQVEAASHAGEPLSPDDAAWMRELYSRARE